MQNVYKIIYGKNSEREGKLNQIECISISTYHVCVYVSAIILKEEKRFSIFSHKHHFKVIHTKSAHYNNYKEI